MIQTHSRKVFRANLDDVENLSYGRGAKKQRGAGSRFTCHRLNQDERRIFDQAKRDGFLTVRGTGYRKNRKGSPVGNTFRQRCDALAQICVVVEKRSDSDKVVIDFSTLRVWDDSKLVSFLLDTIFQSKHPEFYEALIAKDHNVVNNSQGGSSNTENENGKNDDNDASSSVFVENTTPRPLHWESVKTKPIWGVDERLLAVTCDREVAKSIAMDVVKASNSTRFAGLQTDAEAMYEQTSVEASATIDPLQQTAGTAKPISPIICEESVAATNTSTTATDSCNNNGDIDCIDWNDI
jgi:hypothetical protein